MMGKKNILLVLMLLLFFDSKAQSNSDFFSLKNFTSPSPEAAALGRYGDIPTDLSTGVPKIEIPVYEIKSGKLSASISLSYHASGIKFQDIPTPVGLGWVLNAGGSLSRVVVGNEDESANGLLHMNTNYLNTYKKRDSLEGVLYSSNDYTYLENMANGTYDSQSDIYYYSVGDISGKFMYDVDKQMHFTPADRQPSIIYNADTTFTIIDDAGNKYFYKEKEYTQSFTFTHLTAWHLSKIVSADQSDSITYYYFKGKTFNETNISDNYSVNVTNVNNGGFGPQCPLGFPTSSFTTTSVTYYHERKLIDSIAFQNGGVKFKYLNDRRDILPERLAGIRISNSGGLLKEIELVQGYFLSGYDTTLTYAKRLRLDSVKFKDKATKEINRYTLEYNNKELPTFRKIDSNYITTNPQIDLWGYYNYNSGQTLIPKGFYNQLHQFLVASTEGGTPPSTSILSEYLSKSASRYANPAVMDACMIKKISYPTGGYTMFEFEANRYLDSGDSSDYRGGLRVARMVSFDTINRQPIIKTYQYDSALSISQWFPQDLYYQRLGIRQCINSGDVCATWCQIPQFYITATPASSINYYNGSPVIYQKVTEFEGYPGVNKGKTVYIYEGNPDSSYNVSYTNKYSNFSTDKSWARGNLLTSRVYKSEHDSDILVKETRNYYTDFKTKNVKVGNLCERATLMLDNVDFETFLSNNTHPFWAQPLLQHYEYLDVVMAMGIKKLIKTEEIDYTNAEIKNTKYITYESPEHLYPTKTSTLTSGVSDTLHVLLKYPQDWLSIYGLTDTAADAYEGMVDANILNNPVQIEEYRNSEFLTQNRITFRDWGNAGKFYEQYRFSKKGASLQETRTQYKSYDAKGNPLTMSLANGPNVSYIWGYNAEYLVAQVANATADEIAYTSFEDGDTGNWTGGGLGTVSSSAVTGKRIYTLTGGLAKYNLPVGKKYIVSYWSLAGGATVTWFNSTYTASGTPTGTAKKTSNGWTLYEHELPATTANITLGGSIWVDEMRLYPADAQMTSSTFDPLVGTTSTCSVNNMITQYEYDDYGRLAIVRDQDKNIIKAMNYTYQQAQGAGSSGWIATDTARDMLGAGSRSTGIFERKERDKNPSSPTYNNIRWVPYTLGGNAPYWVVTDSTRCLKNGDNEFTGYQEAIFIDQNPYSTSFGKKRWMSVGYNDTACPLPCTGPQRKIVGGVCETGKRVDTGAFYDSETGLWTCVYHYEWSDSSYSIDYVEYNQVACNEEV